MPPTNVVVDGSNIATEGRSTPSLAQLDQAVRQYLEENPDAQVTVVVDASFGHRIDPSERAAFEEAVSHGELVSPPAGAIGRGDAFLLRIAERTGARVLSNDSFREFHAEHPWLFDEDRLVGGTPVPGVGWIFSPRRPVRGPAPGETSSRSRRSKSGSTSAKRSDDKDEKKPDRKKRKPRETASGVQDAIAKATQEALEPDEKAPRKGSRKRKTEAAPEAVNDPLPFITFASEHPVGSQFDGIVVSFTSHGAMAQVGDMLCYVPLAGLGVPAPRRARDVLVLGETHTFQLVALDPSRRGAQLALPEVVATTGLIAEGAEEAASEVRSKRKKSARPSAKRVSSQPAGEPAVSPVVETRETATELAPATAAKVVARPSKVAKPAKAAKVSKVVKTAKTTKPIKPTKVAKASKSTRPAKSAKSAKVGKATGADKPAKKAGGTTKTAKATKSAKVVKTAKPVKAAKATRVTKVAKATKATKAARATKVGKKAASAPSSTPRKVVKSS